MGTKAEDSISHDIYTFTYCQHEATLGIAVIIYVFSPNCVINILSFLISVILHAYKHTYTREIVFCTTFSLASRNTQVCPWCIGSIAPEVLCVLTNTA